MAVVCEISAKRVVVVMPNWLGDGVMATPFLRALRGVYPEAHIAAVARPLVGPVLAGSPFINDLHIFKRDDEREAVRMLRANRFDLGIVLPNSFRAALMLFRGGVKRRLGYARGGRSLLLTDRVHAQRRSLSSFREQTARLLFRNAIRAGANSKGDGELLRYEAIPGSRVSYRAVLRDRRTGEMIFSGSLFPDFGGFFPAARGYEPTPTIDYYLQLVAYLDGAAADRRMELSITAEERAEAETALSGFGAAHSTLVVLVPGANFGSSKCWMPERFAEVADRLIEKRGVRVVLASSPAEMPIVEAILTACRHREGVVALAKLNDGKGVSLGALKEIVRRSRLMVCNDTGPRHFAAAFDVPTVTLFGPTDPVWAETFAEKERQVRVDPPPGCGPCQLKRCPIDHRCMKGVEVEMVMEAVGELLGSGG